MKLSKMSWRKKGDMVDLSNSVVLEGVTVAAILFFCFFGLRGVGFSTRTQEEQNKSGRNLEEETRLFKRFVTTKGDVKYHVYIAKRQKIDRKEIE